MKKETIKKLLTVLLFGFACGFAAIATAIAAGVLFRFFRWAAGL